jgi:hypothetical protein
MFGQPASRPPWTTRYVEMQDTFSFNHMQVVSTQQCMSILRYSIPWKSWWCGAHVARRRLYWMQRAMQSVMATCKVLLPDTSFRKGVIRTYSFWLGGGGTCTTASVETVRGKSSRAAPELCPERGPAPQHKAAQRGVCSSQLVGKNP